MFLISNKKTQYWYKARRVNRGITKKGVHYTFVELSSKTRKDKEWSTATLRIWGKSEIEVGDKIALLELTGVELEKNTSGLKTYTTLAINVSKYYLTKKPKNDDEETENAKNDEMTHYENLVENSIAVTEPTQKKKTRKIKEAKAVINETENAPVKEPIKEIESVATEEPTNSKAPSNEELFGENANNWQLPF